MKFNIVLFKYSSGLLETRPKPPRTCDWNHVANVLDIIAIYKYEHYAISSETCISHVRNDYIIV